ncbi:MAG: hypothetical protein AMXMBFR52_17760 [Burkholderiales bacterium]
MLVAVLATGAAAARPDPLTREIARIEAATGGVAGVAARHHGSGVEWTYHADRHFPMASTCKIAIGACVPGREEHGSLALASQIAVEPHLRSTSSILSDSFPHPGLSVSVQNLLELTLTSSDNTATDVLLDAIGGPSAVQRCIEAAGITGLRVDRSTAQILREFAGLPAQPGPPTSFLEQYRSTLAGSWERIYLEDGRGAHCLVRAVYDDFLFTGKELLQ